MNILSELCLYAALILPSVPNDTAGAPVLVDQLASEDFQVRQSAEETLRRMGKSVDHALRRGLYHDDIAVRWACGRIRASYGRAEYPSYAMAYPWIDSMPCEHKDRERIIAVYRFQAVESVRADQIRFLRDRYAMMLYIRDLAFMGVPDAEIQMILNEATANMNEGLCDPFPTDYFDRYSPVERPHKRYEQPCFPLMRKR